MLISSSYDQIDVILNNCKVHISLTFEAMAVRYKTLKFLHRDQSVAFQKTFIDGDGYAWMKWQDMHPKQ